MENFSKIAKCQLHVLAKEHFIALLKVHSLISMGIKDILLISERSLLLEMDTENKPEQYKRTKKSFNA